MKHTLILALLNLTITDSYIYAGAQEALLVGASLGYGVAIAARRQNVPYSTPEQLALKGASLQRFNKALTNAKNYQKSSEYQVYAKIVEAITQIQTSTHALLTIDLNDLPLFTQKDIDSLKLAAQIADDNTTAVNKIFASIISQNQVLLDLQGEARAEYNNTPSTVERTYQDFAWATVRHTVSAASALGVIYCAHKAGSFDPGNSMSRLFKNLSIACGVSAVFSSVVTAFGGRPNYYLPETWSPQKKALITSGITGAVLGTAFLLSPTSS